MADAGFMGYNVPDMNKHLGGEAALFTSNGMTELQMLVPTIPDGTSVPILMLFLTACMLRSASDADFLKEQVEWLTDQKKPDLN